MENAKSLDETQDVSQPVSEWEVVFNGVDESFETRGVPINVHLHCHCFHVSFFCLMKRGCKRFDLIFINYPASQVKDLEFKRCTLSLTLLFLLLLNTEIF